MFAVVIAPVVVVIEAIETALMLANFDWISSTLSLERKRLKSNSSAQPMQNRYKPAFLKNSNCMASGMVVLT